VRPTNEQFRKAVLAAQRKVGFVATSFDKFACPQECGTICDDLANFDGIRIKVVRRITAAEWKKYVKALKESLPDENAMTSVPSAKDCQFYEVKLLRAKRVRAALEKVRR
jgi:hypothetical protein